MVKDGKEQTDARRLQHFFTATRTVQPASHSQRPVTPPPTTAYLNAFLRGGLS